MLVYIIRRNLLIDEFDVKGIPPTWGDFITAWIVIVGIWGVFFLGAYLKFW